MSNSAIKGQMFHSEIVQLFPERAKQWTSLKTALLGVNKLIAGMPEDDRKRNLLKVAVYIGQDKAFPDLELTAICFIIVAKSKSENETKTLVGNKETQHRLLKCLKSKEGQVAKVEILDAVNIAVVDDNNSYVITQSCLLDWLVECMESEQKENVRNKAQEVIMTLSTVDKNKDILNANKKLQNILPKVPTGNPSQQTSFQQVAIAKRLGKQWRQKMIANMLKKSNEQRAIEEEKKKREEPKTEQTKTTSESKHIMISYSWENQEIATALNEVLTKSGVPTWIDRQNDGMDLMQMLAEAVENASCLLVLVSSHYKCSANCKREANYAHQMQKPLYPVRVERGYSPTGWLGMIISGIRYYDFYAPEDVTPQACRQLIQVLKNTIHSA